MYSPSSSNAPIVFILIIAVALLGTLWLYARYTRLRGPKAVLAWLLTTMAAAAFALYQFRKVDQIRARGFHSALNRDDVAVVAIASGVLILFSVAFAIRLYRKWLDADLTEEERAGGTRGLRAWLSPANLFVAAAISYLAWFSLGWPLVLTLVATVGALIAWPALHADHRTTHNAQPDMTTDHNTSREREKVLSLLESGKITAEESAELLQALAAPSAERHPAPPESSRSVLGIAGAVLVLVGFFLPWFSFSPTEKAATLMRDLQESVNLGGGPAFEMANAMPSVTVKIRGGDIGNGLGWIILILAVGSAMLPHIAPSLDRASLRAFRFISLGAGGVILLYLLSQDISSVAIGLLLALIGYACSALALWREEHPAAVARSSTEAPI